MHKKIIKGFTLFEILVTLIVLSIGLLGLAHLQSRGMEGNHRAYLRSQASLLAYDMVDRMRANMWAVGNGSYDSITAKPANGVATCTDGTAGGCTPAEMATNDAFEWYGALTTALPSGFGTVVAGAGNLFTVTVMWDDDRTSATGTNCSGADTDLKCFVVSARL